MTDQASAVYRQQGPWAPAPESPDELRRIGDALDALPDCELSRALRLVYARRALDGWLDKHGLGDLRRDPPPPPPPPRAPPLGPVADPDVLQRRRELQLAAITTAGLAELARKEAMRPIKDSTDLAALALELSERLNHLTHRRHLTPFYDPDGPSIPRPSSPVVVRDMGEDGELLAREARAQALRAQLRAAAGEDCTLTDAALTSIRRKHKRAHGSRWSWLSGWRW